MATVAGLSATRYYTDNPIWVDVDTTGEANTDSLTLTISLNSDIVFSSKYYTFNNKVSFDLSEIVKGLLPEPKHPNSITSGQQITTNSITLSISLPSYSQTKTFYRGGLISNASNVQVPSLAVLSESEKIPVWQGYPSAKYYLNSIGNIIFSNTLSIAEIENRTIPVCDPVFFRFLNSKGGYSFWLFEEYEVKDKYKKGTIVERRGNDLDLGSKPELSLNVSTRAEERYLATMRALLQSTEIYVYRMDRLIVEGNPIFQNPITWTPVYNAGGNIDWNAYDSVHEVDFSFDLRLKNNPSLKW